MDILNFQPDWIVACCDTCFVGVGEIPHQSVVVKFEIVVLKVLVEDHVCAVGRIHDEVDLLDVVPSKGITNFNGKLHFSEVGAVVGGPLKLLRVVPVAAERFVAAVDSNTGPGQCVGHDLETRESS